ncbi:MAG: bifunctional hydroxymethylpyrimidine kinase/phosphomethylpyrimidine kinase [Vicinamibacterales bacterium]|jgi:hydroxymethylpyrimidine/phosphomethylpyrimidine kinase|nr:bifunctional hydroxymethylpyrimidine kinase/phosphomethylpyrimidine kinase [Vicinamibacterales bacterium]
MPTALTIAGSDSGGGAGLQADLKTFAAHGVHGVCAVTAVTAQNTVGVTAVEPVAPQFVVAQIEAVIADFEVRAVKTGMLARLEIVAAVCATLETLADVPVVVDPVMVATSGDRLLDDDAVDLVRTGLLPRARVVTPNWQEAEVLAQMPIASLQDARRAAVQIRSRGAGAVVITGGHLGEADAIDLLDDGDAVVELRGPHVESRSTHGTGCTFAAAVAAGLAQGQGLGDAVAGAKRYVEGAIRHATPLGHGNGPLNHFWRK